MMMYEFIKKIVNKFRKQCSFKNRDVLINFKNLNNVLLGTLCFVCLNKFLELF